MSNAMNVNKFTIVIICSKMLTTKTENHIFFHIFYTQADLYFVKNYSDENLQILFIKFS